MLTILQEYMAPTNQMVKNLIAMQDAYVNTYHPDFKRDYIFSMMDPHEQKNWGIKESNYQ